MGHMDSHIEVSASVGRQLRSEDAPSAASTVAHRRATAAATAVADAPKYTARVAAGGADARLHGDMLTVCGEAFIHWPSTEDAVCFSLALRHELICCFRVRAMFFFAYSMPTAIGQVSSALVLFTLGAGAYVCTDRR